MPLLKLALANTFFLALLGAAACHEPPPSVQSDAGTPDAETFETPEGMTEVTWTSFQSFSPQTIDPPEDATNAYAEDERAVALGQFLFFEKGLSSTGTVACASCHQPDHGFSGPEPLAVEGIVGDDPPPGRNTPSVLNVGYVQWQFWDGRVDTLWGQAVGPIENPIEMGGSRLALAHYVYDNPDVKSAYEALYGALPPESTIQPFPEHGRPILEPTTDDDRALAEAWDSMTQEDRQLITEIAANVGKSIAAYQMRLLSFDAPFDQFVDQLRAHPRDPDQWDAIDEDAREGARLFVEVVGCVKCHNGPLLSDGKFHNLGLPERDWADSYDEGRFLGIEAARNSEFSSAGLYSDDPEGPRAKLLAAVPQIPAQKGAFRTPSLRNLPRTGPYMHAGQFETLDDVLGFYNEQPEGLPLVGGRSSKLREISQVSQNLAQIKAFLVSLDGQPIPDALKEAPDSPLP